jgi:guanosine-3',5'-bis(diphosphate) 3'-pyrophosphohydrolase
MDRAGSFGRLAMAFDLAARAHEGQVRRDGRREPFVSHVADVARRVSLSLAADETTVIAALLHDVAEKTDHTLEEIRRIFGHEVAGIVAELTDDTSLPKSERSRRQVEAAATMSDPAKRIKLADKASKMASISSAPPRWWRRGKARHEIERARAVAARLRGADPLLEADFDREVARAEERVGTP